MDHVQQQPQPQQQQAQQGLLAFVSKAVRMIVIYWLITSVGSYLLGINRQQSSSSSSTWNSLFNTPVPNSDGSEQMQKPAVKLPDDILPLFPRGQEMRFSTYLSTEPHISSFDTLQPVWEQKHIFAGSSQSNERHIELVLSENDDTLAPLYRALVSNGTVYMHMFFARRNAPIDLRSAQYSSLSVFNMTRQLNQYRRIKRVELRNLLDSTSKEEGEEQSAAEVEIGSYWNPNITVQIVDFFEPIKTSSMPQQFLDHVTVAPQRPSAYYPIVYFNDFWTLKQNMVLLNETVQEIPLRLEFGSLSMFKWQMYMQMEMSLQLQKSFGGISEGDDDEFKRMLIETNPWLLGLTIIVSISHSVLEMLAFKNDISHWKEMKSLEGMSVKTLMINTFFQLVILLYLLDNDTNWLVIGSTFVGILIELWKLKKAISFHRKPTFPYFTWQDRETYTASKTKEYDEIAIRYVSYAVFPLLLLYSIYSVVYESHRSWYSFILNTGVGFIYMFGFIMMVPQLYINYRLKSVAHLPLRAFAYKAVNTFIDDLFSFIIKMPTLHRLACFRDDIIFFIYLYQRWIYPVDKTRTNEFGFSGEDEERQQISHSREADVTDAMPSVTQVENVGVDAGDESMTTVRRRK